MNISNVIRTLLLVLIVQLVSCTEDENIEHFSSISTPMAEGEVVIRFVNLTDKYDSLYVHLNDRMLGPAKQEIVRHNPYRRSDQEHKHYYRDSTTIKITTPATNEVLLEKHLWLANESENVIIYLLSDAKDSIDIKISNTLPSYF